MMVNLRHINLRAHHCYRDPDPINLYHKVGHGTLDMFVLSPSKDSKEVREFLAKWHASDSKLFSGSHKKDSNNLVFPIQNVVSICALLVWQPANPEGTITRILFPGSTPQHKIFEGLDRLKHLEFLKHPTCSAKSLSPSTSLVALKDKPLKKIGLIEREVKKAELKKEKKETPEIKTVKGSDESPPKSISHTKTAKVEVKTRKVAENKKIESEAKESKKIEDMKEIKKKESAKIEKFEKQDGETKKTDVIKAETEKTAVSKEQKAKPEPKKREARDIKTTVKINKPEAPSKPSPKPIEKKVMKPSAEKKDVKSSPTTPKKTLNGTASKIEMSKTAPKVPMKQATRAPSSAPAKSAKDANNRKVVEQKNIEMSSMAGTAAATAASKAAKSKPAERKPISRRTKPVSPSKARVPSSPAKSTRSTPTTSVKSDKDGVIRKVKGDKGTTDSSTVSTPSGIEPDSVVRLVEKSLTEKSEDLSLDSIESKVLADLKEEREVVEEIEAVLQKAERIEEARKEERFEGDDEITAEATDKKDEDMTEDDVTAEIEDVPKKESSRKASQELTEEDEYLIVEKEEIYTEDSVQSGEGEQKHFLDEVESEKAKILKDKELPKEDEAEEKKDEIPEKKLDFAETSGIKAEERRASELLSPEHKEQLKEEMKEIIATATEAVQKTEEKDDSGKKDSEDITKEPSSLSPEKFDSSEKKTTDTDQKPEVDQKEPVPEKMEESQERISTLESGATTTAPTLPEDERITLDEIKEDIDEKHVAEEVKEKVVSPVIKEVIPEEIPAPIVRQSIPALQRDSVKTPDEVADLPVHEEVDPKLYRMDDFGKDKEEKAQSPQDSKEPPTPPVKEQKGMFSFFGKVADKFEKGYDKLTKKKKDSDKDTDDKSSSKSSSPKDPKPKEAAFEDVDMEKVFQKVGKVSDKPDTFEQLEPKVHDVKVATIKETATFLQEEIKDVRKTSIPDVEPKAECTTVDVVEAGRITEQLKLDEKTSPPKDLKGLKDEILSEGEKKITAIEEAETIAEVEALIQESSKKFKSAKDSLRDSLESLEEKGPREHEINLADIPPPTDIVTDTLTGVAEKLGEIKPSVDTVSPISKEPEKVKFTIPESQELDGAEDEEEDDLAHIPNMKEAVRDIGEVLAGTAGIELEEKPKDVIEIVKKVAEVLKEDDFLSEKVLFEIAEKKERPTVLDTRPSATGDMKPKEEDKARKSNIGDIMPKKVGITEQLPSQEEVEEMFRGELSELLSTYKKANGIEVQEEPCIKILKDTQATSPAKDEALDRQRTLEMGADLLRDIGICEKTGICDDDNVDVLEAGLEQVCIKKVLEPRFDQADDTKEEIETSDIGFEQKLSPAKAELVVVTPGSTPTSPKFTADKISEHDVQAAAKIADKLPADIKQVLDKDGSVCDIIEEMIVSKKRKITVEIIEYIVIIKRVSRERVIEIIDTISIKIGIPRESVVEGEDILKSLVVISPQKRNDVEDYIEKEYVNRGRRITTLIIEEISLLKIIPKDVIMEIIESIIIKRKIAKDSVLDIMEDKTQEISSEEKYDSKKEAPAVSKGAVDDQKRMSITEVAEKKEIPGAEGSISLEEDLVEGFVNIPSKDAVAAFISQERQGTHEEPAVEAKDKSSGKALLEKDGFEAVEQEYKVSGFSQSPDVSRKLSETEGGEEDTTDVIEADEKFVKETKGKLGNEKESVLDEIQEKKEEVDSRIRDSEISETSEVIDATEKYLDEAKEKVVAPVKETDEKKSSEIEKALLETKAAEVTAPVIEERKKSIADKLAAEASSEELQEKLDDQEVQDITVRKMLVTASSEDGGHETEICAAGTITFTKSVTPDSLKEASVKSTPDKDSLIMDKDSLHSDESSPEKDSISDKLGPEAKEKVSPVDSLDKSPVGTRDSQDLEDSLEKKVETSDKVSAIEIASEKILDSFVEKSPEQKEKVDKLMELGELKSPGLGQSEDASPAESVFSKSPTENPVISARTSISEKPVEIEIKSFEEVSKSTSLPEKPTADISSSTISEKDVPLTSTISDKVSEIQEKVDTSRSSNIVSEKLNEKEVSKIVDDKIEDKESSEKTVSKSRSSSIVSEKGDLSSVSKVDDIIASISEGKPDDKSSPEQLLDKSRSASIASVKEEEKLLDKSRSTSILSENTDDSLVKFNDVKSSSAELVEEVTLRSRSSSIASERGEIKKHSDAVVDAKHDSEPGDKSKSPSVAGDKPDEKDLLEEAVIKPRSSSIVSEKADLKEHDLSKPSSVAGDKVDVKDLVDEAAFRSRSASIASEKEEAKNSFDAMPDVKRDKEQSDHSKPSSIASDKPDFLEESVTKSRSSSIASEKPDLKEHDLSKPSSVAGDKEDVKDLIDEAAIRSRSASIASEKAEAKKASDTVPDVKHDKEPSDESKSPSIAGDKPGEKDFLEETVTTSRSSSIADEKADQKEDRSKSPSIAGDKSGGKDLIDEATIRSRSASVASEKADAKKPSDVKEDKESSDQSKSPSIASDKPGEKDFLEETVATSRSSSIAGETADQKDDRSKSPSIAGDKPGGKDLIDEATIRSRSASVASEKADAKKPSDAKEDKESFDQSKSPSIAGDKPGEKDFLEEVVTTSRSSSIAGETADQKDDRSKSPSIAGDKPGDKDLIDEATIRSRSASIASEKVDAKKPPDAKEDKESSDQSKSPSIAGDKPGEKDFLEETVTTSRSSSIAGDKANQKDDQSKSPSIAGDKPDEKDLVQESVVQSRSSSIASEKSDVKDSDKFKSSAGSDKSDEKGSSDQSKSPSIAGDKPQEKDLIEEITTKARSSSIASEKPDTKEPSEKDKLPALSDKSGKKEIIEEVASRSRSASIASEKSETKKPSDIGADVKEDKELSGHSKSSSLASDKPDEKDSIQKSAAKSRSSSIGFETLDLKETVDQSKSPSIASDKSSKDDLMEEVTVRSRSESNTSEKAHAIIGPKYDKEPSDKAKSPTVAGDKLPEKDLLQETVTESRSSSIANEKPDLKEDDLSKPSSVAGDKTDVKDLIDEGAIRSRSASIISEKAEAKKPSDTVPDVKHDKEPSDKAKSPTVTGDKSPEKALLEVAVTKSRSSSISSEKPDLKDHDLSKPSSVAADKADVKDLIDEAAIRSRSASIASEKGEAKKAFDTVPDVKHDKEPSDKSKSPSIAGDKPGEKDFLEETVTTSRSSSIADEKADQKEDRSKSPSIAGDKPGDKDLVQEFVVQSRSSSIASEKPDIKDSDKLKSPTESDKSDEKEPSDQSKSPSIAGDKPQEKDSVEEITTKSRSSSIASEKPDIKEPSDKVKSPVLSDKSDEKEVEERSKSPSIAGDKTCEKDLIENVITRSRSSSVVCENPDTDKIKLVAADVSDKLGVKESVDHSKSPSIADDKTSIKDLEVATDKSSSPSVTSVILDEKEISDQIKSATAEKLDEKETAGRSKSPSIAGDVLDETIAKSRTPSISSEKPDIKSTDHLKSSSIAGDKISDKDFILDATIKSSLASIISDKQDAKESFDAIKPVTTGADRSKSPSIAGDKEFEKDLVEVSKSRSSSIVSEKLTPEPIRKPSTMSDSKNDEKSERDHVDSLRSASLISDKLDEDSIDRTKSPSSTSEKSDEKDGFDRSKSPSIDGDKIDHEGDQTHTKSRSPSVIVEKLEHDLTKEELKVDDQDRSRASSVSSTKPEEKITQKDSGKEEIRSRSSSIVSDKPDEKITRSRASSIVSEKGDGKEVLDKSRSPSIPHETEKVQKSDVHDLKSSRAESPTEDRTPKDRSRSHSLFEGGEKTPLGRSRAASVFEDKPSEKINLLDQVKGALEAPSKASILEEKDEKKSSLEKLADSRKENLTASEVQKEVSEQTGSRKQSEAEIHSSRRSSEAKSQIVPDVKDVLHLKPEKRVEIESYVLNECVGKKMKVNAQMLDEMSATHSVSKSVIIYVIEEILLKLSIPRDTIIGFDQEEQEVSHSEDEHELRKLPAEKLLNIEKYISEEYIEKHRMLSLKDVDEIANVKLVPRSIIIAIVEEIILVKKLTRQSILESDILELGKSSIKEIDTINEPQTTDTKSSESKDGSDANVVPDSKRSSLASVKDQDLTTHDIKRESIDSKASMIEEDIQSLKPVSQSPSPSPEPEVSVSRVSFQQSTDLLETQIPEEISISEEKRTEVKTLLLENYINKAKKITETSLQEVINKTGVPRYIILEIIDEIIFIRKLSRDNIIDKLLFLEEEPEDSFERSLLSTPDRKSSGYSTPEIKQFDDKLAKSIPSYVADYESPFHKAFIGGMTEMRTTHITTLSGKSTPDLGGRADTPESDVTSTTGTTSQEVTEKKQESKSTDHQEISITEKKIDKDAVSAEDLATVKTTVLKTTHLASHFDKAEDLEDLPKDVKREVMVYEEEPEVLETVTTKTTTTVVIDEGSGVKATTSEIEKPELYTYIISREGQPDVTDSSKSSSEFVTKVISRESTPEITSDVKRIVTTVTTVTDSNGKVTTMKDVTESSDALEREELLDKLIDSSQGEKSGKVSETKTEVAKSDKVMKETATTVTSTSGVSTPDVKSFYDSGKSTSDPKLEEKLEVLDKISAERLEHSLSPLIRDLVSDDKSLSGKSSPDISLPKDIVYSGSTGKSTPDIPMSPLIKDGATAHPYPSGRSTPDSKKLEGRSRTSTPEGFRSGEVIRTIITTTRTMSDDGEIITTTKEVTEATNEKGETVVITEKTDVKVDDHLSDSVGSTIGDLKSVDLHRVASPGSDIISEREAGPTSPRSDLSSVHSGAATHVWGSSEERHTYSDDEPPSSPLSTASHVGHSPRHFEHESMTSSFYGELPTAITKTETGIRFSELSQSETPTKKLTVEKEFASGFSGKSDSKKYVDEADLDSDKVLLEVKDTKESSSTSSTSIASQDRAKDDKAESKKDPLEGWGSPLGLPSPKPPRKFNLRSPCQPSSSSCDLSPDSLNFDVVSDWGEPLRLPSPAPVPNEVSNKGSPGTPKKERKQTKKVISENIKNKKRSESPGKNEKKLKDSKNKIQPVYMDLTYVPHHGNSYYTALDFFKRIRARYYVFSGVEPSREVYDALLEAKKTWEDKDLGEFIKGK